MALEEIEGLEGFALGGPTQETTLGDNRDMVSLPTFEGGGTGKEVEISEALASTLEKSDTGINITGIKIISKDKNPRVKYSAIVVTCLSAVTKQEIFYTVSIDDGSAGVITPESIVNAAIQTQGQQPTNIYFPTDYIDDSLVRIIQTVIDNKNAIHVGSILLGALDIEVEKFINPLANEVHKSLVSGLVALGDFPDSDITVQKITAESSLKLSLTHTTGVHNDLSGRKTSPTFMLSLDDTAKGMPEYGELNSLGGTAHSKVKGRINFIPFMHPDAMGKQVIDFTPEICISAIDTKHYTVEYLLLALITAGEMTVNNLWVNNSIQTQYNVGVLNKLVNVANVKKPEALDIYSGAASDVAAVRTLNIVKGEPIVAVDCKSHAANSTLLGLLVSGAMGSQNVRQTIIEACVTLTNGNFASSFPLDNIFHASTTKLPDGTLSDKTCADAFGIINVLDNPSHTDADYFAETAAISGQGDSVANRSNAILSTGLTGEYTGTIDKVRFTPEFMAELMRAATSAGLSYSMNDTGINPANSGLEFTQSLFGALANNTRHQVSLGRQQGGGPTSQYSHRTTMSWMRH